jgi:hypothetical protein
METVVFKTKTGELYDVRSIDRKNELVCGYPIFFDRDKSNSFRIFRLDDVTTATFKPRKPNEVILK